MLELYKLLFAPRNTALLCMAAALRLDALLVDEYSDCPTMPARVLKGYRIPSCCIQVVVMIIIFFLLPLSHFNLQNVCA